MQADQGNSGQTPYPNFQGSPNAALLAAAQEITRAINNLTDTINRVFPLQVEVSASAGAATGTYGAFTGNDGVTYKTPLYAES